ncbi:MAG: hypothetical protein IJ398_04230 [Clostridia bacterium]|nr:hypothetical protein [Clostridia bacterium]
MSKKVGAGVTLLVTLISALGITGIGFVDDAIWKIVFIVVGMIAYSIVGVLFSIGLLSKASAGGKAYTVVFLGLIVFGYFVYNWLEKLRLWILSWHLAFKIIVPVVLVFAILSIIGLLIYWNEKNGYEEFN